MSDGTNVRRLTDDQRSELTDGVSLYFGGPYFASESVGREAWALHGGRLMAEWREPFGRPGGWWRYDRGEEPPRGGTPEVVRLAQLGELTSEELGKLSSASFPPQSRRELLTEVGEALPADTVLALVYSPYLFTGLTPVGIDHFVSEVAPAVAVELEILLASLRAGIRHASDGTVPERVED